MNGIYRNSIYLLWHTFMCGLCAIVSPCCCGCSMWMFCLCFSILVWTFVCPLLFPVFLLRMSDPVWICFFWSHFLFSYFLLFFKQHLVHKTVKPWSQPQRQQRQRLKSLKHDSTEHSSMPQKNNSRNVIYALFEPQCSVTRRFVTVLPQLTCQ